MTSMTVDLLKATLPKALQGNATQELADHINAIALDIEVAEEVRSNFLSYTKVLQDGKFKTEDYLNAVIYVTHKLMEYSNQDAWIRTFPVRYQTLVAKGSSPKDISAHVAAYHKNKLVNLILEQSITPSWLLNRDIYQRAINTQFELMTDPDVSDKVRSDAANSILTHLKPPEVKKVELEVGVKNGGGIADLMATMNQLARQQQEAIASGVPARQIARQQLTIDAEFTEVPAPMPAAAQPVAPKTDVGSAIPLDAGDLVHRGPAAGAITTLECRVPEGAVPSLFLRREAEPVATPASAASPAASEEGEARDVPAPTTRRPSLFDPIGSDA